MSTTLPSAPPPPSSSAALPRPTRVKSHDSFLPPPEGFIPVGCRPPPTTSSTIIPNDDLLLPAPSIDTIRAEPCKWRGPTDFSNWVVPGRVLAGAYPGDSSNGELHQKMIDAILGEGVTTFVCLQLSSELSARFRPYRNIAIERYQQHHQQQQRHHQQQEEIKELQFLHFPIPDQCVVEDDKVMALVDELLVRFHAGENLYIHCWGGHGRTGTIVACLLARLHGFAGVKGGADRALDLTSALHCCRVRKKSARSPQHPVQFRQVRRLVSGGLDDDEEEENGV